jgi:hypothetical protein
MKKNQMEAIKQLEAALLRIKRAGLVLVGIDDGLIASVYDDELKEEILRRSSCEAILTRDVTGQANTNSVNHYGAYLDSGGA